MPLQAKTTILPLLIHCAYTLRRQKLKENLKGDQIHILVFGRKRNLVLFNPSVSSLDLSKNISQLPILIHFRLSNNTYCWESLITNQEPPGLRIYPSCFRETGACLCSTAHSRRFSRCFSHWSLCYVEAGLRRGTKVTNFDHCSRACEQGQLDVPVLR